MLVNFKKTLKEISKVTLTTAIVGGLSWWGIVKAGSLTPAALPAPTSYTLDDIYLRLFTNATSTEEDHDLSTGASPAATMHTLNEIYDLIPTIDPADFIDTATYLGVTGVIEDLADYSGQITQTNFAYTSDAGSEIPGIEFLSIPVRYFSNTTIKGPEADFIESNIVSGVDLFGLEGTAIAGFAVVDTQGPLTDNEDTTMTDPNTNLVWGPKVTSIGFSSASNYCVNNDGELPGTGWHLPSVDEWKSVLDFTASGSNMILLPGELADEIFWTSNSAVGGNKYTIVVGDEVDTVQIISSPNTSYPYYCVTTLAGYND